MDVNENRKIRWYEMIYVVVLVGLLGWSVFFMNPHKVAVVDMDRVFKDAGMLQKIEKERAKLDTYNRAMSMLQAYKSRVKGLQEKFAAATSPAEKDKLSAQMRASEDQFNQTIGPMQNELQQFDARAVGSFRKRVQPFVEQVALKHGVDAVLTTSPQILWFRNKVDLTEDVVKASKDFFAKDMPVIDPSLGGAGPRR